MKSINKKGFTLMELLAVIVILAIILAIAIPSISNIISSSAKSSFESDAKLVLKQLEYEKLKNEDFDVTTADINIITAFDLSNANYEDLRVGLVDNKPYIIIVGKGKWNGLKACGTAMNVKVVNVSDTENCEDISAPTPTYTYYDGSKGVNKPQLATGMTPIKWNGTSWINTTESDSTWYNYDTTNKTWANVKTADGSMWVWIPRYIYKISSGWHTSTAGTINIQFTQDTNDNWNSTTIGSISADTTANASNNKWTSHPAFTFGADELAGIWVAKFEASAVEGAANGYTVDGACPTTGDNVSTKTIKIVPNVISWRCMSNSNAFTATRNMETKSVYGWGTTGNNIDTHLMKNAEWGAVTYLSKSSYGQGTNEIWLNNANNYTTGCAANSYNQGASTTGCLNTYDTANGVKASTTGNIYGIYDMSGGAWEKLSAYINNGNVNLAGQGSPIISADSKYKDAYQVGATDNEANNYALFINKRGDALYETSTSATGSTGWFGDYSYTANTSNPWLIRGGNFNNDANAGVFSYSYNFGGPFSNYGFRSVLAVGTGL